MKTEGYSTGHEIRIKFCGTYRDIPQDVPQYSAGRPAIFRTTFRNLTHGVPQSYARRSAILRTAFCGISQGVPRYSARRPAVHLRALSQNFAKVPQNTSP
ncbi:hypothetical protein Bbelb_221010 [Branchiostoma belcheri]|nr:hypothetical protein Bbelb_221010 [Branchiostoma belcheri]